MCKHIRFNDKHHLTLQHLHNEPLSNPLPEIVTGFFLGAGIGAVFFDGEFKSVPL